MHGKSEKRIQVGTREYCRMVARRQWEFELRRRRLSRTAGHAQRATAFRWRSDSIAVAQPADEDAGAATLCRRGP